MTKGVSAKRAGPQRLPSGKWRERVRVVGYPTLSVTRDTRAEAKQEAARIATAMRDGKWQDTREAGKVLLSDVARDYLADIFPADGEAKRRDPDLPRIIGVIVDQWGGFALGNITPKMVADWRKALLSDGYAGSRGPLSGSSTNKLLARLSALYAFAINEQHLQVSNPVQSVSYADDKPEKARRRLKADENEEARLLEAMTKALPSAMYRRTKAGKYERYTGTRQPSALARLAVILAIEAGLREDEIASLRMDRLRLDRCTLTTEKSKNGDARDVPLSPRAVAAINEALALSERQYQERRAEIEEQHTKQTKKAAKDRAALHAANDAAHELVFGGMSGQRIWQHLRDAADSIGSQDLDFHCLRHEAASRLAPLFQQQELQAIMGWRSASMVRTYYHASAEDQALRLRGETSPATLRAENARLRRQLAALTAQAGALALTNRHAEGDKRQ